MDKLDYTTLALDRAPEAVAADMVTALRWAQLREKTFAVALLTLVAAAARRSTPHSFTMNTQDAGTMDRLRQELIDAGCVRSSLELAVSVLRVRE